MRVLHAIEATIGGTRRHIVDLCRLQARAGLEVILVSSALRGGAPFRRDLLALEEEGVRTLDLPMVRALRPAADWRHLRALERLLADLRPDVVHTHCSKAGALGRLASLWSGVGARVHTPHAFAFLFRGMFSPLERSLYREVERALGAVTARLIAVSAGEAETFRAAGIVDPARVRVVENGIDPAPFLAAAPADRRALGVPERAPLACVAGLLNLAKGQDLLIHALAEPGLESLHLLVAGQGEMAADLERLASELGVGGRVRLLGWRDDVPALFAASDVVVLPSRWEAMPYAVLESMASARAVVAAAVDGARELLERSGAGVLAPVGDVQGLGAALRDVLGRSEAERRSMGARGRELLLERYTAEAMARRLAAVYAEVA